VANDVNRFSGFLAWRETVATVKAFRWRMNTPLKQGVNERRSIGVGAVTEFIINFLRVPSRISRAVMVLPWCDRKSERQV
jgi:hypothetical protein